jgi:hypothetical protein
LACAVEIAEGIGRAAIDARPIDVALHAKDKGARLEVGAECTADKAAVRVEVPGGGSIRIEPIDPAEAVSAVDSNVNARPIVDWRWRWNVCRRRPRRGAAGGRSAASEYPKQPSVIAPASTVDFVPPFHLTNMVSQHTFFCLTKSMS